jgi:hypothetical protein
MYASFTVERSSSIIFFHRPIGRPSQPHPPPPHFFSFFFFLGVHYSQTYVQSQKDPVDMCVHSNFWLIATAGAVVVTRAPIQRLPLSLSHAGVLVPADLTAFKEDEKSTGRSGGHVSDDERKVGHSGVRKRERETGSTCCAEKEDGKADR